jgi:hypothetical protein
MNSINIDLMKYSVIKLQINSKYTSFINLCYTESMPKDRSFWPEWAHILKQSGLNEIVAVLLEAGGPINVFLAQVIYAGQPFLDRVLPGERMNALAGLFEDGEESRSFAAFIREESSG